MGIVRVGRWSVGLASLALIALLVASVVISAVIIRAEIRAGGMKDKWVLQNTDEYGNVDLISLLYLDSKGNIMCQDGWSNPPSILSISPAGEFQWRSPVNSGAYPTEGLDGRYYYVDWASREAGPWTNLTSISSEGSFRWSYVVANGTIDLWAVYSDGIVVAHQFYQDLNETSHQWETMIDRVFGISRDGEELWSMNMPIADSSWSNPGLKADGTFVVYTKQGDDVYELGVGKYGSPTYLQKGQYMIGDMDLPRNSYGNSYFEIRVEGVDSDSTVISVYAFSRSSGDQLWRTILGYSDNPHNLTPGAGYEQWFPLADPHGFVFCSGTEQTYCLDANGTIIWKKPYRGILIDVFPSGGLLAWDESSIKRINIDGSVEWRHFIKHDGYSNILLADDETIYYNYGSEVHALVPASGISTNMMYIAAIVVIDVVAAVSFIIAWRIKSSKASGP